MLRASWLRSPALAIGWFLIMNILFFIPGSSLPKAHWLDLYHIDKLVHIGLFAVGVFLWGAAFGLGLPRKLAWVMLVMIGYGLLVEFIQKYWIPNRSFDLWDVLADTAGGITGLLLWWRVYKKNKPL
ncbi:MAG: VanZ family protein [Flavisolibacter sp.]